MVSYERVGFEKFYKMLVFNKLSFYLSAPNLIPMTTTTAHKSPDVEFSHWLKEIDFYKSELKEMQKALELFVMQANAKLLGNKVEQFQNRFIRQREVIDILRHDVKAHENDIQELRIIPTPELRSLVEKRHIKLRAEVGVFIALFVELEQDFNDFLC